MIKLKSLVTETFSSQTMITRLTPKVKKMVNDLQKKYPMADIQLVDNYKWLGRDNLKGTYTLSVSLQDSDIRKSLKKDIDKIYDISK